MKPAASVALALAAIAGVAGLWGCSGTTPSRPVDGGELTLAAEQEPACLDWIGTCDRGSEWAYWILGAETMPRAFDVQADATYAPAAVLDGDPVVSAGPPATIIYRIRAGANWSDGQPITAADFKYTWQEITAGSDVFDRAGYDQIASVDASDPKLAVVTLKRPYGAWRDLFSAFTGILPSHLLAGRDRGAALRDGYTWSGGPWKLDIWRRGQDLRLVPNPAYWGPKPHFRSVTFRFLPDPTAEIGALASGQVNGGYPQPQPALLDGIRRAPVNVSVSDGLAFEAVWMNTEHGILRDPSVREALAYATDRDGAARRLIQVVDPHVGVLESTVTAANRTATSAPFSRYGYNPARAAQLMRAAGWMKGPDGVWARDGVRAALLFRTTLGNPARRLVQQLLENAWKLAGFDVTIRDEDASALFGTSLPKGDFDVATFTFSSTPDAGQCVLWCSDQIPSIGNHFTGQNFSRISSAELDADWAAVEQAMDATAHAAAIKAAESDLASELPVLPLYPRLGAVVMHRAVRGPVGDNAVLGPFWNMEQWYATASGQKQLRALGRRTA